MPNWAENQLTISGDTESLNELKDQMSTPYEATYLDRVNKAIKTETQEGVFMLWNAIRPTDLRAYWKLDELEAELAELNQPTKPQQTPEEFMEAVKERLANFNEDFADGIQDAFERMQHDIATKQDWYNWNLRNWGTKWDITEQAWLTTDEPTEITYSFMSAWSCPDKAVMNLAKQYPQLTFTLVSADFSMDWALEMGWENGEVSYEIELPLTHELAMRLNGECWQCDPSNDRNPELEEEWGCHVNVEAEVDKFIKEVE